MLSQAPITALPSLWAAFLGGFPESPGLQGTHVDGVGRELAFTSGADSTVNAGFSLVHSARHRGTRFPLILSDSQ